MATLPGMPHPHDPDADSLPVEPDHPAPTELPAEPDPEGAGHPARPHTQPH